ncbi:unnamed protein product [Rotaria sp. Silwood2]|nr:unnamed protein product [Rotaria sp. Silwood2]CAF3118964.1 unnamed protein product [Rotaria sp. Silwood2]CAF3236239.1 unnamed protein product [Rotaria sp. Silwood2]CAF4051600.1 unnamed protein product [Rotaria sp. Silwood2]CAF4063682.1 unnamed protein product [Rotaria sp. Silwood2]
MYFSDIINIDETNEEYSINIASQDSVFNDETDRRLLKLLLTSIQYQFKNTIEKDLDNLFGKTNINNYSTWFSLTFRQQHRILGVSSIRQIEIPGQYSILQSLRLPKRLTIRGHDENDYQFLVKNAEDIRQDQRIEALCSIISDL